MVVEPVWAEVVWAEVAWAEVAWAEVVEEAEDDTEVVEAASEVGLLD